MDHTPQIVMRDENKLYAIQGYGDEFEAGRIADGRQVLMGLLCPHIVVYFFAPDGALAGGTRRLWDTPAPQWENGSYKIYDKEFERLLRKQIVAWQSEMRFEGQPIAVKAFFDEEHYIGIEDLPDHLSDLSWEEDEAEGEVLKRHLLEWQASGNFVLWWGKDYWMTASGEVEST